jgi:hypothetical protein
MDLFKAEFGAMQDKAPAMLKSLGGGKIPMFVGNVV